MNKIFSFIVNEKNEIVNTNNNLYKKEILFNEQNKNFFRKHKEFITS